METENQENVDTSSESDQRRYPFGLSSRQLFVVVVLLGLIGPGLLVSVLEEANLATLADLVWIIGYGTMIVTIWYIWIRPMDLVGSAGLDISYSERSDQANTGTDEMKRESADSNTVESSSQDTTSTDGDTSQGSTREHQTPSESN
jgi:hypothetical protein